MCKRMPCFTAPRCSCGCLVLHQPGAGQQAQHAALLLHCRVSGVVVVVLQGTAVCCCTCKAACCCLYTECGLRDTMAHKTWQDLS